MLLETSTLKQNFSKFNYNSRWMDDIYLNFHCANYTDSYTHMCNIKIRMLIQHSSYFN